MKNVDKVKENGIEVLNKFKGNGILNYDDNAEIVYTYILKDIKRDIYKIGRTSDPHQRFKGLCKEGKVYPIALISTDVEKDLHEQFSSNRMFNKEYRGDGGTEWFARGGKFNDFIDSVDTGKTIPFITLHKMTKLLIKQGVIKVRDSIIEWELDKSKFGFYSIGITVLSMVGYLSYYGNQYSTVNPDEVFIIKRKIAISERLIKSISNNFTFELVYSPDQNDKKASKNNLIRIRKVKIGDDSFDSDIFLILKRVL